MDESIIKTLDRLLQCMYYTNTWLANILAKQDNFVLASVLFYAGKPHDVCESNFRLVSTIPYTHILPMGCFSVVRATKQ